MRKISVQILGHNHKEYLGSCIDSVKKQNFKDLEIVYIDNASEDDSAAFIRRHYPEVKIIENKKNIGFSAAYNLSIKNTACFYILILNPDVILDPSYLSVLLSKMEKDEKIAGSIGKLYKINKENRKILDSTGLTIHKDRRVFDRGQGEKDKGQFNREEEVFGATGAAALFRKSSLEAVKIFDQYFDEDFFAYKEDADLCWRLRIFGYKIFYIPSALAYHRRAATIKEKASYKEIIANRKKKSFLVNYHSLKNYYLLIAKNDFVSNILIDFFPMLIYQGKMLLYVLFFEPRNILAYLHYLILLPKTLRKRSINMANAKITPQDFRQWLKK